MKDQTTESDPTLPAPNDAGHWWCLWGGKAGVAEVEYVSKEKASEEGLWVFMPRSNGYFPARVTQEVAPESRWLPCPIPPDLFQQPITGGFEVGDIVCFKFDDPDIPKTPFPVIEVRENSIKLDNGCWYGEGAFKLVKRKS